MEVTTVGTILLRMLSITSVSFLECAVSTYPIATGFLRHGLNVPLVICHVSNGMMLSDMYVRDATLGNPSGSGDA